MAWIKTRFGYQMMKWATCPVVARMACRSAPVRIAVSFLGNLVAMVAHFSTLWKISTTIDDSSLKRVRDGGGRLRHLAGTLMDAGNTTARLPGVLRNKQRISR